MEQGNKFTFLLADDHQIVRQGLRFIVEELFPEATVFEASRLKQIELIFKTDKIDAAVLDAQFPDGNCFNLLPELKKLRPDSRILIFTSFDEENYSLRFLEAGADGFLSKLSEENQIREALSTLMKTGKYYPPFTKKLMELSGNDPARLNPLAVLSDRELQIAELYAKGYGNLEIANELDVKQNTVSTFKKRIFEKLHLETLVDLIEFMKVHHNF